MSDCDHKDLEPIGEQKTDDGVNKYFTCKSCGSLIVVTPGSKVYRVKGTK